MNRKKIALIALLITVIAAAALFAVKRVQSELKGPPLLQDQKFDKIDMKSFKIFSETLRDWTTKYTPDAVGRYKNPKTGEYTMVDAVRCASCGQLIPVPQLPAGPGLNVGPTRGRGRGARPTRAAILAAMQAREEFLRNYKCPRCGRNAFPSGLIPSPP